MGRPVLPSAATIDANWSRHTEAQALERLLGAIAYMDACWNAFIEDDDMDIAIEAIGELREANRWYIAVMNRLDAPSSVANEAARANATLAAHCWVPSTD